MDQEARRALLWLASVEGLAREHWEELRLFYDSPLSLWQDFGPHALRPPLYAALQKKRNVDALDAMLEVMDRLSMRMLWFEDEAYPPLLRHITDAPLVLFVRGEADLTAEKQFAIVGSRVCTRYGKKQAAAIAGALAKQEVLVVSGLARGIDVAANTACAELGYPTVAVLGCGLDACYPPEHQSAADHILEAGGALVSEYPPGMPPMAHHFPRRNRIISGMCTGILLVEAARRSGSMITVRLALEQGREVFALPGPVDIPTSYQPLRLLREGATPITSAQDILEDLGWAPVLPEEQRIAPTYVRPKRVTAAQKPILDALREGPLPYEKLAENTNISASELNSLLTMLELEEIIEQLPGRNYAIRIRGEAGRTR